MRPCGYTAGSAIKSRRLPVSKSETALGPIPRLIAMSVAFVVADLICYLWFGKSVEWLAEHIFDDVTLVPFLLLVLWLWGLKIVCRP
jgi:hypothetical protein